MFVKYLQNPFAISRGLVITVPFDLNDDGKDDFLLLVFITSLLISKFPSSRFLLNQICYHNKFS